MLAGSVVVVRLTALSADDVMRSRVKGVQMAWRVWAYLGCMLVPGVAYAQTASPLSLENKCSHPVTAYVSWQDPKVGPQMSGPWPIPAGGIVAIMTGPGRPRMHNGGPVLVHAESSDKTGILWVGPTARGFQGVSYRMASMETSRTSGRFVARLVCPTAVPPSNVAIGRPTEIAPGVMATTISRDTHGGATCRYDNGMLEVRSMADGRSSAKWQSVIRYTGGTYATLTVSFERDWNQEWVNFNDMKYAETLPSVGVIDVAPEVASGGNIAGSVIRFNDGAPNLREGRLESFEGGGPTHFALDFPDLISQLNRSDTLSISYQLAGSSTGFTHIFNVRTVRDILPQLRAAGWRCP